MFPLRPFLCAQGEVSAPADALILVPDFSQNVCAWKDMGHRYEKNTYIKLLVPSFHRTFVAGKIWGTSMTKRRMSYV